MRHFTHLHEYDISQQIDSVSGIMGLGDDDWSNNYFLHLHVINILHDRNIHISAMQRAKSNGVTMGTLCNKHFHFRLLVAGFTKRISLIPGLGLNYKTLSWTQFCIYSHNIWYWTGGTSPPAQYKIL